MIFLGRGLKNHFGPRHRCECEADKTPPLANIAKQLEEAKANPDIPEVEVMIRAGRIRETLKDEMLDVVKPDLVLCGARGLSSIKYALLGSISTFLLRNTDCDILVVK